MGKEWQPQTLDLFTMLTVEVFDGSFANLADCIGEDLDLFS